jgi:hypothetical protein
VNVTLTEPRTTLRVDGLPDEPMRSGAGAVPFLVAPDATSPAALLPRSFELWLDPGTHVFILTKSQGGQGAPQERIVESRTLESGGSVAMEFAFPPTQAPAPTVAPAASKVSDRGARKIPPDHTAALVAFGAGAAGLAAGGIFAGLALDEKSTLDSDQRCTNRLCPEDAAHRDRVARMRTFSDVATAGLAAGVVGAAVGTYLWVTAKSSSDDGGAKARAARVPSMMPWVGAGSAGVLGRF